MELKWNGVDITNSVNITGCKHTENASQKSDCLELTLDHASRWYGYRPEEDDEIELMHEGYTTGKLYLNAIIPEGDQYRILATSVKRDAARKAWASYQNETLQGIFDRCAAECGMKGKLFGLNGQLSLPFTIRQMEGAGALLTRVGTREGACVKARNGSFLAVSVPYAQEREPDAGVSISAKDEGATWRRRDNTKYTSITVQTPWASATARDEGAKGNNASIITCLPAMDNAQAGRWARGLLLMHNRGSETLSIQQGLKTSLAPMGIMEITGGTGMSGTWMIDRTVHDFMAKQTTVDLLRVIQTIE